MPETPVLFRTFLAAPQTVGGDTAKSANEDQAVAVRRDSPPRIGTPARQTRAGEAVPSKAVAHPFELGHQFRAEEGFDLAFRRIEQGRAFTVAGEAFVLDLVRGH